MRKQTGEFLERCRILIGVGASGPELGFNGAFIIPRCSQPPVTFRVICSDGECWEHVSVSLPDRCPTWDEMCWVKDQFWYEDEVVMQLHPPRSQWVNNMRHCLHLWKPTGVVIPLPPSYMVGIKELGTIG